MKSLLGRSKISPQLTDCAADSNDFQNFLSERARAPLAPLVDMHMTP